MTDSIPPGHEPDSSESNAWTEPDGGDLLEHPADLAARLEDHSIGAIAHALGAEPLARRAEVYAYLAEPIQDELVEHMGHRQLAEIIAEMNADERADLFNRLSDEQQEKLLPALDKAVREDVRRLAGYEEGTAGAIMTTDYAALPPQLTVREAVDRLRQIATDTETINRLYVIDDDRRLLGSLRLQDLILAKPDTEVGALMDRNTLAVQVDDDAEDVARQIAKYDIIAVPVLDLSGRMVGIVTHDDALDVAEEAATEDFHRVATVGGGLGNLKVASFSLLFRKRAPWLVLLIFGNLFSGAGIAYFEDTIAAYVALVFFLPLLIDSGGNAGSQSATMMVRALATGEVVLKDWGMLFGRELLVSAALGVVMALAVTAIGVYRGGPEIALVVATTMMLLVMVGSLIGMSVPFVLSVFRLDPATASAPLITTISDAVGVIIYFSVASAYLTFPT